MLFTLAEIRKALDSLPTNKSPGPDGYIGEYLKNVKTILAPYLITVFNSAVASPSFPQEMLKYIVITLPKIREKPRHPAKF